MEEIYRTHKDVPFGWLEALRAVLAARAERRAVKARDGVSHRALDRVAMG